jgi:hypothetical protein
MLKITSFNMSFIISYENSDICTHHRSLVSENTDGTRADHQAAALCGRNIAQLPDVLTSLIVCMPVPRGVGGRPSIPPTHISNLKRPPDNPDNPDNATHSHWVFLLMIFG